MTFVAAFVVLQLARSVHESRVREARAQSRLLPSVGANAGGVQREQAALVKVYAAGWLKVSVWAILFVCEFGSTCEP